MARKKKPRIQFDKENIVIQRNDYHDCYRLVCKNAKVDGRKCDIYYRHPINQLTLAFKTYEEAATEIPDFIASLSKEEPVDEWYNVNEAEFYSI